MIAGSVTIRWHGVRLALLAQRAIWMPCERALLVADVHLGKPTSFRVAGVPVPEGVTGHDLDRLRRLVEMTGAERLVVLGDLVHDSSGFRAGTGEAIRAWRASVDGVGVSLVPGNHDRGHQACAGLGIEVLEPGSMLGGLGLRHEPGVDFGCPTLCGHLHPAVSIGGVRDGARVRSACFRFEGMTGVLPAFGRFTGGRALPTEGAAVYAAGPDAVVPIGRLGASLVVGTEGAPAYDLG